MSIYNKSKSQKRSSQSQSKNGGRRRKNTMRKLRRGRKSRKVIRGGGGLFEYADLKKIFDKDQTQTQMNKLLNVYGVQTFDEFKTKYQDGIPSEQLNIGGLITDIKNKKRDDELISFLEANKPQ
jgi:hypothetical protein